MTSHVQCLLERENVRQTAWIPANLAKEGMYLELRSKEFGISNGWKVISAYVENPLDSEWVRDRSRDYMKQRSMSDI